MEPEERFAAGAIVLMAAILIYKLTKVVIGVAIIFALMYGLGFAADKILERIL